MFRRRRPLSPGGRPVVITGASSGLGRAGALHLEQIGFRVFAAVRRTEDGKKLLAESRYDRISPIILDVTKPDEISSAADEVSAAVGSSGLWGLVNNAGISVPAPLECLPAEQLRLQLETNLVGQLAVIQAFLPQLRARRGRIVNVTSGLGRIALPYLGAYAASQFAKEGMSDALRRELAPFGVSVSVVQPGAIRTPIWEKMASAGRDIMATAQRRDLYQGSFDRFLAINAHQLEVCRTTPDDFAAVVAEALTARRPRTRYPVGADMRRTRVLTRLLPDSALDKRLSPLVSTD
ncbi:short-subunit dehydrogenase [Micromonospora sp. M71_S20]|nr:short-subunit dehydrogenase [Micromonospora sp. M71_S20]